ncbi:MAG: universal stress protein [Aestuariivirga sp.]
MKHILSPTDGSEHSLQVVALAAQFAVGMNCRLSILVVKQYIIGRSAVVEMWTQEEIEDVSERTLKIAQAEGFDKTEFIELRARDIAHAILDFAEKNEIDHIVIGTAGRTGMAKFLLGSTTTEVLKKSFCPVTIVH